MTSVWHHRQSNRWTFKVHIRNLGGLQGDIQYEISSKPVWHGRCITDSHRKSRSSEVTFESREIAMTANLSEWERINQISPNLKHKGRWTLLSFTCREIPIGNQLHLGIVHYALLNKYLDIHHRFQHSSCCKCPKLQQLLRPGSCTVKLRNHTNELPIRSTYSGQCTLPEWKLFADD